MNSEQLERVISKTEKIERFATFLKERFLKIDAIWKQIQDKCRNDVFISELLFVLNVDTLLQSYCVSHLEPEEFHAYLNWLDIDNPLAYQHIGLQFRVSSFGSKYDNFFKARNKINNERIWHPDNWIKAKKKGISQNEYVPIFVVMLKLEADSIGESLFEYWSEYKDSIYASNSDIFLIEYIIKQLSND